VHTVAVFELVAKNWCLEVKQTAAKVVDLMNMREFLAIVTVEGLTLPIYTSAYELGKITDCLRKLADQVRRICKSESNSLTFLLRQQTVSSISNLDHPLQNL
jgi:reverse gyrase